MPQDLEIAFLFDVYCSPAFIHVQSSQRSFQNLEMCWFAALHIVAPLWSLRLAGCFEARAFASFALGFADMFSPV